MRDVRYGVLLIGDRRKWTGGKDEDLGEMHKYVFVLVFCRFENGCSV